MTFEDKTTYTGDWDYGKPVNAGILKTKDGKQVKINSVLAFGMKVVILR